MTPQASAKAATQSANTCGKLSFVKVSTRDKVACGANNLVEAIAPGYMTTGDGAFKSAVNGLETFGIIDPVSDALAPCLHIAETPQLDVATADLALSQHALLDLMLFHTMPA